MADNKTAKYQLDALAVARAAGLDEAGRLFPGVRPRGATGRAAGSRRAPRGGWPCRALAADAHQERAVNDLHWLTAAEIGAAYAARRPSPGRLVRGLLGRVAP